MAKFRKQIKSNFTTVHNDFIDDLRLGNDTIGLLLKMVKLPDDWNFSIKGLAAISKDGEHKISRQLKELEEYGYLVRKRIQSATGQFADWEYIISDEQLPDEILMQGHKNSKVTTENSDDNDISNANARFPPHCDFPDVVNPNVEYPDMENRNAYKIKNNKIKNNKLLSNQSNQELTGHNGDSGENNSTDSMDKKENIDKLKKQLNYEELISEHADISEQINVVVNILADCIGTTAQSIRISKQDKLKSDVLNKISQLEDKHVLYVLNNLNELIVRNPEKKPKNIKAYLLTSLYNAPDTYDGYGDMFNTPPPNKKYSFDLEEYKTLINNFD